MGGGNVIYYRQKTDTVMEALASACVHNVAHLTSALALISGFIDGWKSLILSKWRRGAMAKLLISSGMLLEGVAENESSSVCLFVSATNNEGTAKVKHVPTSSIY